MGTIKSDLCSEIHGDVGDKTYRTTKAGKVTVNNKAALPTFRDEEVKDERDKRISGFGGCSHMSYVVGDAIMLGFPPVKRGEKPLGKFMKYNAVTLCKVTTNEKGKFVWVYDFPGMVVSKGNLLDIEVTATFDEESGVFMFKQEEDDRAGSRAKLDDMVYAFVLDGTNEIGELVPMRTRAESGSTSFSVPRKWDKNKLFVYVFTVSKNKWRVSNSTCIYPAS